MKKSLVLAMALALGVSATAFAANPFSDLPAGHWAYASVAKLAAAGIVDGYPDGTFKGDRTMTRYEMAQIVAKALAKGAIGADDKLVGEFADELDNLGVRVAKLEKHADNFKITAQVRYLYEDTDASDFGKNHNATHHLRTRMFFTGDINDNWKYIGMLENKHTFSKDTSDTLGTDGTPFTGITDEKDEGTAFQRAYLEGRLGGAKVRAGRFSQSILKGIIYANRVDGITAQYGDKIRVGAFYTRPTNESTYTFDKAYGGDVRAELGKNFELRGGYTKYANPADTTSTKGKMLGQPFALWNAGIGYNSKKLDLGFDWLKSNLDLNNGASNSGWVISANWMGAKPAKVGTYGIRAKYHHQGVGTFVYPSVYTDDQPFSNFIGKYEGFKGWSLEGTYTIAKNTVAAIEYYNYKGLESGKTAKTIASHLLFTF